jgi:hypothetical protein
MSVAVAGLFVRNIYVEYFYPGTIALVLDLPEWVSGQGRYRVEG